MNAIFGLIFLLFLCAPQRAAAQSLKEVRVGSSNISVTNAVAFYARDRKFFEAEGFDVKMIIIKTEAALAALTAGDLDYSTLSTSAIEGTLKGLPLRVIAITNRHPLLGLVVRKGINSVADLRGKKLSVTSFGGATYGAALYLLKNHGLRPKEDVIILAGGTNSVRIAALKQGAVDAVLMSSPDDIKAAGRRTANLTRCRQRLPAPVGRYQRQSGEASRQGTGGGAIRARRLARHSSDRRSAAQRRSDSLARQVL